MTSGANCEVTDEVGMSVLHLSCYDLCLAKVKYFIDLGLNINAVDCAGFSPLHIAAQYSSTEVVKLLLDKALTWRVSITTVTLCLSELALEITRESHLYIL